MYKRSNILANKTVPPSIKKKSLLENAFDRRIVSFVSVPFAVLLFVHFFFADELEARSNFVLLCAWLFPFLFSRPLRPLLNVKKAKRWFRYPQPRREKEKKRSVARPGFPVCEFSSLRRRSADFNLSRSFDGHFCFSPRTEEISFPIFLYLFFHIVL